MKKIYITIVKLVILSLVLGLNSCSDDFLEETPAGNIIAEKTKDYDLSLNDNRMWLIESIDHIVQARSFETCAFEPYFSGQFDENGLIKNHFTWKPNVIAPENTSNHLLPQMRKIYIYNKVINEVLSSSGGTKQEKERIRAEALAGRAMVYFHLVNVYGQPYNVTTASTNLAVPIVTEANVTETNYKRATVKEVYDFIVDGLLEAIPNLSSSGIVNKVRMTQAVAKAFLGKIYVYQQRFEEAIPLFEEAFNLFNQGGGLAIGLYDYNIATLPGGAFQTQPPFGTPSLESIDNIEIVYTQNGRTGFNAFENQYLISPEVSALYGPSDFRLNYFASRKPFPSFFSPDLPIPGAYRKTSGFDIELGIKIPDLYLLRAECRARTNNLSGAIEDLEFLRKHRMNPDDASVPVSLSQDDLIKFVIDERTREFALLGETWFDLRRLWNDPLFQFKKPYIHTLYDIDGSVKETYELTEKRLVLRFSDRTITNNPGMVNNPE